MYIIQHVNEKFTWLLKKQSFPVADIPADQNGDDFLTKMSLLNIH